MIYTYTSREDISTSTTTVGTAARRALEDSAFPFEELSDIAELESWRKEINRPIYHMHKWWAQRLGSVFRGILIGAAEGDGKDVLSAFFAPANYPDMVVFDPFMGSGTTIGEALKLGMRGIGRDINQVAYFAVRTALTVHPRERVIATFEAIERDVASQIRGYYRTQHDGALAEVLYYFWVKVVDCPSCEAPVDLFSSYVFARHAYPRRHPEAQVLCPACGEINQGRYDSGRMACRTCHRGFDAQAGPAHRSQATCRRCDTTFPIGETIRRRQGPPEHRLYAKLVLLPDGTKAYLRADAEDVALYEEAEQALAERSNPFPIVPIQTGHNTNQVINYGYRYWHEMFNARQLLVLSLLAERIRAIDNREMRELFACLFSGALEFNNMFASYKGEGTGAVRHMFAHHILKPERTPIEANLWGTPKSSGSFSTLFRSRLLRALDYQERPFEIRPIAANGKQAGEKIFGLSDPMGRPIADSYSAFALQQNSVYLSCGDSATTDLPASSVDLVVTDPPFFDNVHYSELADFFHVWQRHVLNDEFGRSAESTRSDAEVQSRDVTRFAARLQDVFAECHRVLRPGGLLVFTYHHSRPEGWHAILDAINGAGFVITAAHPIKAEMSVAAPKAQANSPIDLDVIVVCRRAEEHQLPQLNLEEAMTTALEVAADQARRLSVRGRSLSRNDVRVIVMAQIVKVVSCHLAAGGSATDQAHLEALAAGAIDRLYIESVPSSTEHLGEIGTR